MAGSAKPKSQGAIPWRTFCPSADWTGSRSSKSALVGSTPTLGIHHTKSAALLPPGCLFLVGCSLSRTLLRPEKTSGPNHRTLSIAGRYASTTSISSDWYVLNLIVVLLEYVALIRPTTQTPVDPDALPFPYFTWARHSRFPSSMTKSYLAGVVGMLTTMPFSAALSWTRSIAIWPFSTVVIWRMTQTIHRAGDKKAGDKKAGDRRRRDARIENNGSRTDRRFSE